MKTWYDTYSMTKKAEFAFQPTTGVLAIPSSEVMDDLKKQNPSFYQNLHRVMRGALEGGRINELLSRLERVNLDMYIELLEFVFDRFPKKNIWTDWLRGK